MLEILLNHLVTLVKPERKAFIFRALAQKIVNSTLIFAYVIVCSHFKSISSTLLQFGMPYIQRLK